MRAGEMNRLKQEYRSLTDDYQTLTEDNKDLRTQLEPLQQQQAGWELKLLILHFADQHCLVFDQQASSALSLGQQVTPQAGMWGSAGYDEMLGLIIINIDLESHKWLEYLLLCCKEGISGGVAQGCISSFFQATWWGNIRTK